MADELVELPLGSAGEDYVARRLENGNALSRLVLRHSRSLAGRAVALVPPGTDLERALRLDEGALVRQEPAVAAVHSYLAGSMKAPGAVFVAEDDLARRGDPAPAQRQMPLSFYGDEIYWWTAEPARVPEVLRATRSHFLNCFVTLAAGLGEELSETELDDLARATSVVAINAYDDESFVLCRASAQATTR